MRFSTIVVGLALVLFPIGARAASPTQSPHTVTDYSAANRTIFFSDLEWSVKTAPGLLGPGPNYYTDDPSVVWVDSLGLHLRIVPYEGRWYCSEICLNQSLGYGEYTFYVQSNLNTLDPMAVLGLFTWDQDAPEHNYREIDIEFCQCGVPVGGDAQYTVQPWDSTGNVHRYFLGMTGPTEHSFRWCSDRIDFASRAGEDMLETWSYTGDCNPPPGDERVRMNLWLVGGQPPLSGEPVEVIITGFRFCPVDLSCQIDSGGCLGYVGSPLDPPASASPEFEVLGQNYPNPFDPATTIDFHLEVEDEVSLKVYDVSGKLVRTLVDGVRGPGRHTIMWDGRNDEGRSVASGAYFYQLTTNTIRQTRRAILVD